MGLCLSLQDVPKSSEIKIDSKTSREETRKSPSISTKLQNIIQTELYKFNIENKCLGMQIQQLQIENNQLKKQNEEMHKSFDQVTQDYAMVLMGSRSSNTNVLMTENDVYRSKLYKSSMTDKDKQYSKESRILMNNLLDRNIDVNDMITTSSEKIDIH